ncbi:MAG: DUF192 domain-containing protein [Chlamydiota bacterium]
MAIKGLYRLAAIIMIISVGFACAKPSENTLVITNSYDEQHILHVEIADTKDTQRQGLMNRESLEPDCGMLFVFDKDVNNGFWMKDTTIPLSIAFIAKEGIINEICELEPLSLKVFNPQKPYRYALEVNQGYFDNKKINAGNLVFIP